eukprot:6174238-Pleurochrysis_carterae.AAC.2
MYSSAARKPEQWSVDLFTWWARTGFAGYGACGGSCAHRRASGCVSVGARTRTCARAPTCACGRARGCVPLRAEARLPRACARVRASFRPGGDEQACDVLRRASIWSSGATRSESTERTTSRVSTRG